MGPSGLTSQHHQYVAWIVLGCSSGIIVAANVADVMFIVSLSIIITPHPSYCYESTQTMPYTETVLALKQRRFFGLN